MRTDTEFPSLPSGDLAIGVAQADYNRDGNADLVVEVNDTNVREFSGTVGSFAGLVLYAGDGSGGFAQTSSYLTVGHPDVATLGIVVGDFNGPDAGLEVAVPVIGVSTYVDVVPLAQSGTWGAGVLDDTGGYYVLSCAQPGNIVTGDFNGSGKPSIALSDDTNQVRVLLADPDSNSILPVKTINFAAGGKPGVSLRGKPGVSSKGNPVSV